MPRPRQVLSSIRQTLSQVLRRTVSRSVSFTQNLALRFGFDRSERLGRRMPLIGPPLLALLARTIGPLDRTKSIRLAWRGRKASRDIALVQISTGLFYMHKYAATRWWAGRATRSAAVRRLLDDLIVEALFRENKIDDARAFAQKAGSSVALQHRVGAEAALRRGDDESFERHLRDLAKASVIVRRPYLRWLQTMASRLERPTDLLTQEQAGLVLEASQRTQNNADHRKLGALLSPSTPSASSDWQGYRSRLEELLSRRRWSDAGELASSAPPVNSATIPAGTFAQLSALRADALSSVGRADEAEQCLVSDLQSVVDRNDLASAITFFPQVFRRVPNSREAQDLFRHAFRHAGLEQPLSVIEKWKARPNPAFGLPQRNGDKCFLIGNGPSLAQMNLGSLAGYDIFCVNRGFQAKTLGLPQPRFLAVMDPAVYRDYGPEIDVEPIERLFLNPSCMLNRPANFGSHVSLMGTSQLFMSMGPLVPNEKILHLGSSLIIWVAEIAFLMGYREINIMGVDLSYSGPAAYFYESGAKEARRLASFREGDSGPQLVNVGFENLKKVIGDRAVLRNVGIGGNLTALDRMTLEEAVAR